MWRGRIAVNYGPWVWTESEGMELGVFPLKGVVRLDAMLTVGIHALTTGTSITALRYVCVVG
jgi:hypothetical protein